MTKRFLILLVGLFVSTITFTQEDIEKKINRAFDLYNSEKIDEAYLLAQEINAEFEKDTIGLANHKVSVYLLNALTFSNLGQYSKAIEYYINLIRIQKEVLGEDHLDYLSCLNNLAFNYSKLGQFSEALKINLEVTDKSKIILGENHPDYLTFLSNIATNYSNLGQFEKALEINLELVDKRKTILRENHPDYLSSLSNLALNYTDLGLLEKALEINLEVVNKEKTILGEDHSDYLTSLSNLAICYSDLGQFEKALKINLELANKRKTILGENHPDYLTSLSNLTLSYSNLGQLDKALEVNLEVTNKWKILLGENHPDYLTSLSNLSSINSELGQFDKALEINLEVANKRKTILGEDHPRYLTSLSNLAKIYSELGQFEKALEINLEVAKKRKITLGENHPYYLTTLSNLASYYFELGQFDKALEINLELANKRKTILGEDNPDYLTSLSYLANNYLKLGQLEKALEINLEVANKRKIILGENHPRYLTSLSNLAICYSDLGQLEKALEINLELVNKEKIVIGEDHPHYLTSLSNLAICYSDLGQLEKALEIDLEVVNKRKIILGEDHPNYLISLNNLAQTYSDLGQSNKAFKISLEVANKIKKNIGEDHPDYFTILSNLASNFSDLGQFEKALEINLKVANKRKEIFGENHLDYVSSLSNLASNYSDLDQLKTALEINLLVANKRQELLGEEHPDYLICLSNLASNYSNLGQLEKAFEITLKVANKMKILGEDHPDYIIINEKLATAYDNQGNISASHKIDRDNLNRILHIVQNSFSFLTEAEKENYTRQYSSSFEISQSFAYRNFATLPSLGNENYNLAINTKGQVLQSNIIVKKSVASIIDTTFQNTFDQWVTYKKMIEKLSLTPIPERTASYNEYIEKANELERKLVKASGYLQRQKQSEEIKLTDIQHHLKENEIAIEFISFKYFDKKRWADSTYYVALLLNKSDSMVKYIPLFEERELESLLAKKSSRESLNINTLYKNSSLYDLIWNPLSAYIPKGSTVYYSPDGMMHQVHVASIMDSDSTYLSDSYQLVPLNTTATIAMPKEKIESKSIAVFGGLEYDMQDESTVKSDSTSIDFSEDIASRSYFKTDSDRGGKWTYLPGTLEEANNVINIASQQKLDVKSYVGVSGTEENFKGLGLMAKSPSIVHISSHGFFFPDPKKDVKKMNMMKYGDNPFTSSELTLNRAGLLFSGANKAWTEGTRATKNQEDGILTALEVSSTALLNTDLVVLSACETGLGDIKGSEGVYGLQRAFKMAGVRYLMMSLWKVPDNTTQEFMTTFYTELLTNKRPIREAYTMTQKQMRDKYRNEPYKWAGFVLIE
jgi:tetratricopeptide (TPR) repeat protein